VVESNPVRLLVKEAVVPLLVKELAVVGLAEVLQHTPTAVRAAPPVAVTAPPELAEFSAIEVMGVVVSVGATAGIVKLSSFP
jgi:hypothetical protein